MFLFAPIELGQEWYSHPLKVTAHPLKVPTKNNLVLLKSIQIFVKMRKFVEERKLKK